MLSFSEGGVHMFDNIGGKIKVAAQTICWMGIALSAITGIRMALSSLIVGFLVVIAGSILSWLGSFAFYGLGQLIENSGILIRKIEDIEERMQPKDEEERLIMLRDWKDRGLITEEEFLILLENESY